MRSEKQLCPFGLWNSPITPQMMGTSLRFGDVQWDSDGKTLVWLEGRSDCSVLVCQSGRGAVRDLTSEQKVQGGVGYGGGEFIVSEGRVFYAEKDGRLYICSLTQKGSRGITPPFGKVASPILSPDGLWVVYVHTCEQIDSLAIVDANGKSQPVQLVGGSDFYMQPAWHPDGNRIAWIEWDHPNMPWDETRLKLAKLNGIPPSIQEVITVAGGQKSVVFQPAFSPDGSWLSYILSEGEWDKLCLLNLKTGQKGILVEGGVLALPAWVQGLRVYGWSPDSRKIYYLRNEQGFASLWVVEVESGLSTRIDIRPYTWLRQISVSPVEEKLAFLASSPSIPEQVVTWTQSGFEIHRRSAAELLQPEDAPVVRPIRWKAPDGVDVNGLYYAPSSSRFMCDEKPPAIVYIHGGPTSQVTASYDAETIFFTTRGYAMLYVNYRGSTGYGRSYQDALRGQWGLLDVEDAVGGAHALIELGLADPDRLVIKGGSAGGYTVLNALIRYPNLFKAGICLYGVSNLFTLVNSPFKFEERYLDSMVGSLPEASSRYHDWSPVFHADQIRDALAIFQGSDDKVVLPAQSESIVAELRAHHIPYLYRLYEGEGHGFRKIETLIDFYTTVEQFLQEKVIYSSSFNSR